MNLQKITSSKIFDRTDVDNRKQASATAYASASLLQRPLSEEYQAQQTAQLAAEQSHSEQSELLSALVFRLAHEWFAIPARLCQQVMLPVAAHSLPHRSNATLLGVVNVRGQMLLKVSLLDLLGLTADNPTVEICKQTKQKGSAESSQESGKVYPRMVVIGRHHQSGESDTWVFDVDELDGIHTVRADQVESSAAGVRDASTCTQNVFVWQEQRVSFLNEDRLFEALRRSAL